MSDGRLATRYAGAEERRIRDAYARRSVRGRESWFYRPYCYMIQDREQHVLSLLARRGLDRDRLQRAHILEIGCGTGQWLRDLVEWGASPERITGVDLLEDRIAAARRLCAPGITLMHGTATALDLPAQSFDLVLQSTVFTSILDPATRRAAAAEMVRVLRPGGTILWYDYYVDNPANPDVRGVPKREIHDLFPGCEIELRRATLAPPIARAVAPLSLLACRLLELIPLLRTHYLGAITTPDHPHS